MLNRKLPIGIQDFEKWIREGYTYVDPFSLLNALYKKNFGMYWFATGTPTFLIEKLKASCVPKVA